MTEEQRRICLRAIDHFGVEHQKRKAVEEMGELIAVLAREQESREFDEDEDTVEEEIADVIIMAEQLRIIYGQEIIDREIEWKLRRLTERMKPHYVPDCSMAEFYPQELLDRISSGLPIFLPGKKNTGETMEWRREK